MSNQISFDALIMGSLNEAFITKNSFFSIDSIGDCVEQGSVLESSKKPVYTLDDPYRSVINNKDMILHSGLSSKDSTSPSNVYPGATYNTVKLCVSIVKNSGCMQIVKNQSHNNVSFINEFSSVDDAYDNVIIIS